MFLKKNLISLGLVTILNYNITQANALPEGFVYLDEIDKTIITSPRYFGNDNFVGKNVDGYKSSRIILTKEAAQALSNAQSLFKKEGYSIVVYDGYRPQTAVNHFIKWSEDAKDQSKKTEFYPRIDKKNVFELGYVAKKSGHSRGSTVDLTLIPLDQSLHAINPEKRKLEDGFEFTYLNDGTLDYGSHFDLFDEASHNDSNLIKKEYQERRIKLKEIMQSCNFKPYKEEYWHFTLINEPYPDTYFDFPVE